MLTMRHKKAITAEIQNRYIKASESPPTEVGGFF